MTDRHNIAKVTDGGPLPAPVDATAADLGHVIDQLATLAVELKAPVVTEELRLAQYRRVKEYAKWLSDASGDLAGALDHWIITRQDIDE